MPIRYTEHHSQLQFVFESSLFLPVFLSFSIFHNSLDDLRILFDFFNIAWILVAIGTCEYPRVQQESEVRFEGSTIGCTIEAFKLEFIFKYHMNMWFFVWNYMVGIMLGSHVMVNKPVNRCYCDLYV